MASEDVSTRIATVFPSLSRSHKQIARFVVDNETFVAYASAAEVAQKVGVSPATVVRFCQALGYEGYPHLQAAIRQEFPHAVATFHRIEERLASPISEDDLLARVFAVDIENIKHTMELASVDTFESAVAELDRAANILVVGGGASAPPALFLAHSLKAMGFRAQVATAGGPPLLLELSALEPGDILVAISFWRYLRQTVEAVSRARENEARVIAITDSELSPLAQMADHVFLAGVDGVAHSASLIAPMSLINAFIAALAFRRPQQTLSALRNVDAAYKGSQILLED
jgi:DNA-binding MurR/RpiR family transcriptional regulator